MLKFDKSFGGREKYKSVKYQKDITTDCVIRSIAIALDQDYKSTFYELLDVSRETLEVPSDEKCYDKYLEEKGWVKKKPKRNSRNRLLKVGQFPTDGVYLIHTSGHLTCLKDGVIKDVWNCSKSSAYSYYRKEVIK